MGTRLDPGELGRLDQRVEERRQPLLGARSLGLRIDRVELPDAIEDLACLRVPLKGPAPVFRKTEEVARRLEWRMKKFGRFLVGRGALTRAQLDEAIQSQVVFGGRLGTNLVELGYLRLDELEQHLSDHLGVPVPPAEWLEKPSREALAAVPRTLVERHGVLPLALEERTLHMAMLDPRDPSQVDELAFATGFRVRSYVLAEVRISALVEHYYGIARDTRYINLGPEAARGRHAPASAEEAALGRSPPDDGQDLIDEETFSSLHESWQGVSADPPDDPLAPGPTFEPTPAESERGEAPEASSGKGDDGDSPPVEGAVYAAALEAELEAAGDRDTVGRLALRIARLHASSAALFVVRGGMMSGFCGDGEGMNESLDGILIPVEIDSIFSLPATARTPFRGRPPKGGIDARVLAALSRRGMREVLVHPIAIRDRVINLLYADNGSEPLAETSIAALGALCDCVARAYERLILEQKVRLA
jgi:hypothetical protein